MRSFIILSSSLTNLLEVITGENDGCCNNITDVDDNHNDRMSEQQRSEIRVLAGVKFTRRHVPNPVDNVGR